MAVSKKEQRPIRPVESPESPETPETRPGIEQLREIYEQARELIERRRRGFLAAAGATGFVLLAAILMQTPLYESSSLLLVKFGRELVYQAEVGSEQAFVQRDKESVINSELAIARSRPVLAQALRQVGIASVYPDLGEALEDLRGPDGEIASTDDEALIYAEGVERVSAVLTAQALPEADVLSLAFPHSDPHVSAKFVNALVDSFLEAHLSAFGEPRAVSFLSQRVEEYQQRLDISETAMLEFETQHAAFALESPQSALVQWRDAAEAELATIDSQMAAIRLRHLQEDTTVAEARNQLLQLEREAAELQGELLSETKQQIAVVRRFIGQRRFAMGGELDALEEKKAAVREQLDRTTEELAALPTLSARYRALQRQRDADEEQYRTYARRLRDAKLSSEMDREKIASINVIQPATPSPRPSWPPSKATTLPIAVLLALLAGALAALALDRIGPTGIAWLDGDESSGA